MRHPIIVPTLDRNLYVPLGPAMTVVGEAKDCPARDHFAELDLANHPWLIRT